MTVHFARPLIAGIAATLLLTMSSCTDDKPKPIPEPTGSTAPSPSPAPAKPKLTKAEQEAFDKAVDDYATVRTKIAGELEDPVFDQESIDALRNVSYNPAAKDLLAQLKEYADKKVRLEGERRAAWQVPSKVDLDGKPPTIVWQQCNTPGDLKVLRDGKDIPQEQTNRLLRITSNPDNKGFWRLTELKEVGTC